MADTLSKLQRIRNHQRKAARIELARAQREQANQKEKLAENRTQVDNARSAAESNDSGELARYHAFQLRMEMARRREQTQLERKERNVASRQEKLVHAMREVRVVERLQEIRAEEDAQETRRTEDQTMDEVGLQGWKRHTA